MDNLNQVTRAPSHQNPKLMTVSIPRGHYLFEENDEATFFYIIQEGDIEISVYDGQKILATLSKGDSFGELALLGRSRRLASARALTDTKCLEISMTWMQDELDRGLPSVKSVFAGLAMQLQQNNTAEVMVSGLEDATGPLGSLPGEDFRSDLFETFLRSGSYKSVPLRGTPDIRNHIANARALVVAEPGIVAIKGDVSFHLEEGAVIGLAECLAGTPIKTEFSFRSGQNSVTAWVIDTHLAMAAIRRQNAGIVGIIRGLTAAITKSDVKARFERG